MIDIPTLATQINLKAASYEIGGLQELRKQIKHFARRPGNAIFTAQTTNEKWAFHHGGRAELQFNIGYDGSGGEAIRHGVAFSFETSQTLPDIDVLRPNVAFFNEFLKLYPTKYDRMRMWHWEANERRSETYSPSPIPGELIANGIFVFLGVLNPIDEVDVDEILKDFDDLLPLYKYVESKGTAQPVEEVTPRPFLFRHGCTVKKLRATARQKADPIDISLRHNVMQLALYERLSTEYGRENVGSELSTGNGTRVDIVVKQTDEYWFYEIKTYHSPRACIREALGQLLEYSHWPTGLCASKLVVVGESKLDSDARDYLAELNTRYSLPIEYMQITP